MSLALGMALVAALASCGGRTPVAPEAAAPSAVQASESGDDTSASTVELRFDQTTDHAELQVDWVDLEDSRCPTGVNCVWAGQLVVTIEVRRQGDEPVSLELLRRIGRDAEPATAFGHVLRLDDVAPHPKQGVEIDRADYVATIEIGQP